MNERILALAVKSGHIVDELPLNANEKIQLAGLEKFAEMIVKECAGVAEVSMPVNSDPDVRLKVKNSVLKNFGVEE